VLAIIHLLFTLETRGNIDYSDRAKTKTAKQNTMIQMRKDATPYRPGQDATTDYSDLIRPEVLRWLFTWKSLFALERSISC